MKDGEQANYKDAFIRRFAAIFQPVDWFFALGKGRQRMGDKLAKTVVIKLDSPQIEIVSEDEKEGKETDLDKILEDVIMEITNRFSEAKQKVDASIGIENSFKMHTMEQSHKQKNVKNVLSSHLRQDVKIWHGKTLHNEMNIDKSQTDIKNSGKNRKRQSNTSQHFLTHSSKKHSRHSEKGKL